MALLVTTAFIINSCRKDSKQSANSGQVSGTINANIPALQALYNNAISGNHLSTQSNGKAFNFIRSLTVDWGSYTLQKRQDSSIVAEFNMKNDTGLFSLKPVNPGDTIKFINKTTVTFITFKNGSRLNFFTKIIEDLTAPGKHSVMNNLHYNQIPSGFTGEILYYTLDLNFINGIHYTNGAIDETVTVLPPGSGQTTSVNSLQPNESETCTLVPIYQTYCEWGGTPDDPYKEPHGCTTSVVGTTIECSGTPSGGGTAGGDTGGGSGAGSTTPVPCTPPTSNPVTVESVSNGHLTINVQQPPPGGGSGSGGTTPQPCPPTTAPPVVPNITNNVKNPCLNAMVNATISANVSNQINSLIQNVFGSSTTLNITFVDVNDLGSADGYSNLNGGLVNGKLNVQIQLDNTHLPNYSQQYIARVIMHEALHAYLTYMGTSESQQHESMIVNYVTVMAASLQQMFPGLSSSDAQNLALGGLQLTTTFQNTIENDMNLSGSFGATNIAYSVGPLGLRCNP